MDFTCWTLHVFEMTIATPGFYAFSGLSVYDPGALPANIVDTTIMLMDACSAGTCIDSATSIRRELKFFRSAADGLGQGGRVRDRLLRCGLIVRRDNAQRRSYLIEPYAEIGQGPRDRGQGRRPIVAFDVPEGVPQIVAPMRAT